MPKDKRSCTIANKSHECFYKPYSRSNNKSESNTKEETAEWKDVTCPICMEPPHNAVLLVCSSNDKGCRPFMCDTSYRHSNCLDQYLKKAEADTTVATEAEPVTMEVETGIPAGTENGNVPSTGNVSCSDESRSFKTCKGLDLACPLCRGKVEGWKVIDKARQQLNLSRRSCAQHPCTYVGTYEELRKHARVVHPFARPLEIDPVRREEWLEMEADRDLGDVFSSIQSAMPGATIMGDYVIEEGDEDEERDDEEEESEEDGFAEENVEAQQQNVAAAGSDLWTMVVLFQLPPGGGGPRTPPGSNDRTRHDYFHSGNLPARAGEAPRASGGNRSLINSPARRPPSLSSSFDIRRLPEYFERGSSRRLPENNLGGGSSRRPPESAEAGSSRRSTDTAEGSASSSRALERSGGYHGGSSRAVGSRGTLEWNSYSSGSRGSLEHSNSYSSSSSRGSLEQNNLSSSSGSQRRSGNWDRNTQARSERSTDRSSDRSAHGTTETRRHNNRSSAEEQRGREEPPHDYFLRRQEPSNRGEREREESSADYFLRRHGHMARRNNRR